jgi:hypothetical protein
MGLIERLRIHHDGEVDRDLCRRVDPLLAHDGAGLGGR